MDNAKVIYCIGDSHVSFFSGYNYIQPQYPDKSKNKSIHFISYRIGSVIAYNLIKLGTKEMGRESLQQLLKEIPHASNLLLCFGEIDNRCHLLKQSHLQEKPLKSIIVECVDRYFRAIDEIIGLGFKVSVFAALPSCESSNLAYPTYGSMLERNISTQLFNEYLNIGCKNRGLPFINMNNHLIYSNGLTKVEYFFDGIHLGQFAFPLFLKEISKYEFFSEIVVPNKYILNLKIWIFSALVETMRIKRYIKRGLKKVLNFIFKI